MPTATTPGISDPSSLRRLEERLRRVRASLVELEQAVDLAPYGSHRESARNLLHYLAFRRIDLRREQARLAHWGLSSLGRSESHVLYNLDAVLRWLGTRSEPPERSLTEAPGLEPEQGRRILDRNARSLFGPTRPGRRTRIMVTLPSEAADEYGLVRDLVASGMDCARINCAHDGPAAWGRMVAHVRRAARERGRPCPIEMDLGGPKLRTGPIRPGPQVLKVRPARDALGRVERPGSLWLVPSGEPRAPELGPCQLELPLEWLRRRQKGERVRLGDARGAKRSLHLLEREGDRWRAEVRKTTYFTSGTRLEAPGAGAEPDVGEVGPVAPLEQPLHLTPGERLVVTARPDPGEEAVRDAQGRVLRPAHVACTLPEALAFVRAGESIWFDDGHIGGVVRSASPRRLVVEITHAGPGGGRLAGDKGINLPQTDLRLSPIPPSDLEDLRFIVRHADLVGYSFVHTAADLDLLRAELHRLGRPRMGLVVKVETGRAFEELPSILLGALRQPPVGVMIARGDLAVEVGYDRLAEVQEEILWLCEAAHLPAIWATQVLEGLAKTGLPSRAEVTDAAMGERAECVMLNKGPHVVEAVRALDSILRRMQSHQAKKTAMLRHLHVVEPFFAKGAGAVLPRRQHRSVRAGHRRSSRSAPAMAGAPAADGPGPVAAPARARSS